MGLLTRLLTLPVSLPVSSTLWIARKIAEAAETERNDPAALKRALGALEASLEAGEIGEAEYEAAEAEILGRLGALEPGP